jgi:hypothetical protein
VLIGFTNVYAFEPANKRSVPFSSKIIVYSLTLSCWIVTEDSCN